MSLLRPHDAAWRGLLATPAGRLGFWGLVMLLAAAAAAFVAQQSRSEAEALAAATRLAPRPPAPTPAVEWPAAGAHAARVRTLLGLAQRHGVVVRALRDESAAPAGRGSAQPTPAWRGLGMTAEGRYGALRRFVAAALAADAALALDSLLLQRPDGDATLMRAELAWSLAFVPAGAAAPAAPRGARP